jgi:hypothetical protein
MRRQELSNLRALCKIIYDEKERSEVPTNPNRCHPRWFFVERQRLICPQRDDHVARKPHTASAMDSCQARRGLYWHAGSLPRLRHVDAIQNRYDVTSTTRRRMTRYEEMYLEFVNDFLTLDMFAEHHNITPAEATMILIRGRRENKEREQ